MIILQEKKVNILEVIKLGKILSPGEKEYRNPPRRVFYPGVGFLNPFESV